MDGCPLWVLCLLSDRGLCDGLITRPEESYRLWCVLVCDLGTSRMRRLKLIKDCKCRIEKRKKITRKFESAYSPPCSLYAKAESSNTFRIVRKFLAGR
jgi:hypothetical protein